MNIINVSPPHKTSIQHVVQPFRCAKSPLPLFSLSLLRLSPPLLRLSLLTFIESRDLSCVKISVQREEKGCGMSAQLPGRFRVSE